MQYLRLSLYALVLFLGILFAGKFINASAQQCDPTDIPAVRVEESVLDEVAARYHLRSRVNRFFKRSRRA